MKPEHLRIESGYSKFPKGGQQVGMPSPAVRVTHIPSGLSASCDAERSQMKNKNVCLAMLEWGLLEIGWKEPEQEYREALK